MSGAQDGVRLPPAVLIAGPTASGKSALALALALAERIGATIVNADSMQVYRDLRIIMIILTILRIFSKDAELIPR